MALWIQRGWRIPNSGLKQWMWNPHRALLQSYQIGISVYDRAGLSIQKKYQQMHRFNAFRTGFPNESFENQPSMPVINVIDCKREGPTKAYPFSPSMFSENSTAGSISVF